MKSSDSAMPRSLGAFVIGLAAVAALSACAQGGEVSQEVPPLASRPAPIPLRSAAAGASDEGNPVSGEVPAAVLSAILADATERTGVPPSEITVTRGDAVTWNDGSLGCPEPGMFYTQALVDGYHVVLDVAGEALDYRVGTATDIRPCENPTIEGGG